MTKNEFLNQLNQLLFDLPEEERMDAIWYYEDYLADAGPENEEQVLKELVSPERVAEKIHAGSRGKRTSEAGEYTEHGYEEPWTEEKKYPMPANEQSSAQKEENSNSSQQDYSGDDYYRGEESFQNNASFREEVVSRSRNGIGIVAAVLFWVFIGVPIILPCSFALICVLFSIFVGFGIGGVALIAGGVACVGTGIGLTVASSGLTMIACGAGLMLAALGLFMIVAAVNCGFRAIPCIVRGVVSLLRRCIFRKGARV